MRAAGKAADRASLPLRAAAAAATEPTPLTGPAGVSAAVPGSPLSRHPRTPQRPSELSRRLCAAAHPRLRRATRRLCRVSGGGGDARSHVSPRLLGAPGARSARTPGVAREPRTSRPRPLTVARLPRLATGPWPTCSPPVAPPCPLDARAASARTALGALGRGPPARRGPGSLPEQSPGEAARPGQRDLPQDGAPERGGCCWAEDELGCRAKDMSIPRGIAKDKEDSLRSWRQICP